MHLSDGDALSRLYGFSVDVQVFGEFVECLKTNVEVSCTLMSLGRTDEQERLKKLISDPANDSKMIDDTLVLKRFVDRSIAGLFTRDEEAAAPVDETAGKSGLNDDDEEHERTPAPVGFSEVQRKLELEDAVRKGFRAGMSSRENAPAEWIGMSSQSKFG
jgi:cullin-4